MGVFIVLSVGVPVLVGLAYFGYIAMRGKDERIGELEGQVKYLQNIIHEYEHGTQLSSIEVNQITSAGQMFFGPKVSEILMEREVQEKLKFDNSTWERETYTTGLGLDLLSETAPEQANDGARGVFERRVKYRMKNHGGVVIKEAADPKLCKDLAMSIYKEMWNPTYDFGSIMAAEYRKDYPLEMNEQSMRVFRSVLGVLYKPLRDILGGDAVLTEFASIFSFPGAEQQNRHPDAGDG